jgi:hypothetical protein
MRRPARVSDGLGAFVAAPPLAWSGWRLGIPGGPEGGQYHGFIAADSKGFRTSDLQEIGPSASAGKPGPPPGPSSGPWSPWWGGTPLGEGDTVSDYVYRSSAELRPRPNASGGTNTVRALQEERTAGYAEAPGNYRALGAAPPASSGPFAPARMIGPKQICPAWGCGEPPIHGLPSPYPGPVMGPVIGPTSTVPQPPPPTTPVVGPVTSPQSLCPPGYAQDAAGNCVYDERNPYSLYLPDSSSPAPAPTVAASTCPTGYTQDPTTGNCLAPGQTASTGISAWLGESTTIGGIAIPNALLAAAGALFALKMMRK